MRLANLKEYRSLVYSPDSAPTLATLRRNIRKIPGGRVIDGPPKRYYVDLDVLDKETRLSAQIEDRLTQLRKSPELEGLL